MSSATVIIAKQNKYIRRFQEAGAITPEAAVELDQIGCRNSRLFQRLVDREVFKLSQQGKYYLDPEAAEEFKRARRIRALTALIIVLVLAAILLTFSIIR